MTSWRQRRPSPLPHGHVAKAEVSWIGADGVAAATQDAREARSWLLTLRSVDERWLLWEVSAEVDEAR